MLSKKEHRTFGPEHYRFSAVPSSKQGLLSVTEKKSNIRIIFKITIRLTINTQQY